jgi:hypothetical protein
MTYKGYLMNRDVNLRDEPVSHGSIVSLFSGCGGMDLGFIGGFDFLGEAYPRTGFEIIWAMRSVLLHVRPTGATLANTSSTPTSRMP